MSSDGLVVWEGLPVASTSEEFAVAIRQIANFEREWKFRLGQWLSLNLKKHGEEIFWQWVNDLKKSHAEISNLMWVANEIGNQYTPEIRWSWWQSMAAIPADERTPIIEQAIRGQIDREGIRELTHKNGRTAVSEPSPLIDALILVGKLLSREAKGENVDDRLTPALDTLIAEAIGKKAKIDEKLEREV